jgi:hypothetical protein
MTRTITWLAATGCALALAGASAPVVTAATVVDRSTHYRYTTVDWPQGFATTSAVNGVNDNADIVGVYDDADGNFHGFVGYRGRRLAQLDYPGARQTFLIGIGNNRSISGTFVDGDGVQHGFTYRAGAFRRYDVPGAGTVGTGFELGNGLGTSGFGINDRGDLVGQYGDADGLGHGYVARASGYATLDHPDQGAAVPCGCGGGTSLLRINNSGTIAGNVTVSPALEDTHPFLYRNGIFTAARQPPDAIFAQFLGLSNAGVASGVYFTSFTAGAGWLYDHDRVITVRAPMTADDWFSSIAQPNNSGTIVGEYVGTDLRQHGYVATPLR